MAAIQDTNQLSSFVKEVLEKGKSKYRSNLGIGSPKYVESMKCSRILQKSQMAFAKKFKPRTNSKNWSIILLKFTIAVREISIWHSQIMRRLRKTAFVQTGWSACEGFAV